MKNFLTISAIMILGLSQSQAQCPSLQTPFDAARGGLTIYADASTFTGLASSGNTVEGGVRINGGTGTLSGDGSSATGELSINGDLVIENGAVLDLTSGAQILVYGNIYILGNSTLNIASGSNLYYFGGQLQVESGSSVTGNAAPVGNLQLITPRPANGSADVVSGIARPTDTHSGYSEGAPVMTAQYLDGNSNTIVPALQNYNTSGVTLCNFDLIGTANVTTTDMGLQPSTTFVINGNTLTVNGAVTGTGTLSGSSTSNLFIGGAAGTLNFTSGSQILKDLTLNNNSSASLGTPLDITAGAAFGTVTVNNGASLASNGNLVMRSDADGTSRVAESNGSITGDATVERFIPPTGRAWRLLTIPVTSSTKNIRDAWASGRTPIADAASAANEPANDGTLITGYNYATALEANNAGFDWWAASNSSIRKYVISGSAGSWPGTGTPDPFTKLDAVEQGYMLFIRGDRKLASIIATGSTTLRPGGSLKMGTKTVSVPAALTAKYKLLGNPYASNIDFEDMMANSGNSDAALTDRFWTWEPTNGVIGGFFLIHQLGPNNWEKIPAPFTGPGSVVTNIQHVQSSQAIMIEASVSGGDLTINEEDKSNPVGVLPSVFDADSKGRFYTNLNLDSTGSSTGTGLKLSDGVLAAFADGYTKETTDIDDISKVSNFSENIALLRNSKQLSLEAHPTVTANDTLFFAMSNLTTRKYALQFKAVQLPGVTAFLQDTYLGKETAISTDDGVISTFNFEVSSDAASAASDRFRVVFKPTVLPLTLTNAKAYQQNNGIQVDWKTVNEAGVKSYEVEKSVDGRTFSKTTSVTAIGGAENNYGWFDAAPFNGDNYYRIKLISTDGKISYSQVLRINILANQNISTFVLYPNPVKDSKLTMQLTNIKKGKYTMTMYNAIGQLVMSQMIEHQGGSVTEEIKLGDNLASGVYKVSLGKDMQQTLVIQR